MKRLIFLYLPLLMLAYSTACTQATSTPAPMPPRPPAGPMIPVPPTRQPPPAPSPAAASSAFAFGIEYMNAGLAKAYAPLGAPWVRSDTSSGLSSGTFGWGSIEPSAPKPQGQREYRWADADRIITEWQGAGMNVQIYTSAQNRWASSQPQHHFPDPQHLGDYETFFYNLVERYDGDGERDMPGLKAPILDYTVEAEWTEFFPGTTDEYLQLLALAYRAAKRADENTRIRLVPLMMIDIFDGNPSPDEVTRRSRTNRTFRHPVVETQRLLARPTLFDIVEIHSLGDFSELYPTAEWLRAEMRKHGYSKPLWVGDAVAVSTWFWANNPRALTNAATNADFLTFAPIRPGDPLRAIGWLDAIKDTKSPKHAEALAWFRALQSKEIVKKSIAAMDAGYDGINFAWLADNNIIAQQSRILASQGFQAFADVELRRGAWTVTALRPVFHTYQLTISKLSGATRVERMNLGANIYAYRVSVRNGDLFVLWRQPDRLYFPDEQEPPPASVNLPINAQRAAITRIVTALDDSIPRTEVKAAPNGNLPLTLDSTPIFVEALR